MSDNTEDQTENSTEETTQQNEEPEQKNERSKGAKRELTSFQYRERGAQEFLDGLDPAVAAAARMASPTGPASPKRKAGRPPGAPNKGGPPKYKANSVNAYRAVTGIPKRLEAIYVLMCDSVVGEIGPVLTREELDMNPTTQDLPTEEKDILARYWPRFTMHQSLAREIAAQRKVEIELTLAASKKANAVRKSEGMDDLTLPEQLKLTAKVYDRNIQNAALTLASTTIEDLNTDQMSLALYKVRVQYIKDFGWIREKLVDLAYRIEQEASGEIRSAEMSEEAIVLLTQADAALVRKGTAR